MTPGHNGLRIGDVAERSGLSVRTIRYYDEMGLLGSRERGANGQRRFEETHLERLAYIARLKPLGFTAYELRELLLARDALSRDDLTDARKRQAAAALATFARDAGTRSEGLRRQAAAGDAAARALQRDAHRAASASR